MYNKKIRNESYKKNLLEFIQSTYSITPISISEAKRGYFGETWRLESLEGRYFIKLDYSSEHKEIYKNSFPLIQHLTDSGIDFISKIIKTKNSELLTEFKSAVLGIFQWIEGENIQNDVTKIQEYKMLSQIYKVPWGVIPIAEENFTPICISVFYRLLNDLKTINDETAKQILCLLNNKADVIAHREKRLCLFSNRCKTDISHFYITHGDAGGNIIVNGNNFYIVDWDAPMLAPPERDAWFCMQWNWATDAFEKNLCEYGINYKLSNDRLAYYCYFSFFYYLTENLKTFFEINEFKDELVNQVAKFFDGWIEENIAFADNIK